jgi:L-lactate dehydrogenase (cytochrome)
MRPSEILHLLRVARPPAAYGAQRLARCSTIDDVERVARRRLPPGARPCLENGGEGQHTLHRNRMAFRSYVFQPRQPRDVSDVDTSTTVLGRRISLPFALSPVGAPRMFHHEGELAVARAARHAGIPYGISTLGNTSVEDVAAQTDTPLWFQMYIWGDRSRIKQAVARAKAAGFDALLLNIDTAVRSERVPEKHAGLTLPAPQLSLPTLFEGRCTRPGPGTS